MAGCSVKEVEELSDSEKFASEYNITTNNSFKYKKYNDIINILDNTGIIFFASPDYEGSEQAAKLINEVATSLELQEIYYYNPDKLKEKEPGKYNKIKVKFKDYIKNNRQFNLPIIVSIKNGEVVGYDDYFSKEKNISEENFTKKVKKNLKDKYIKILSYERECTDCD